ncbi:MAG: hypothetical protein V2A74_05475 [bacterium]
MTWVSPYMTHPPLSFWLGSLWLRWGPPGGGLKSYRQFNALLGIVSLALMFWLGWRVGGLRLAVLAGLLGMFETTHLQFHRMGFPYNLYQVEALAVFLLIVFYLDAPRMKRLLPAVVVASLAAITVYYAVALWLVVGLAVLCERKWRQIPTLALLPFSLVVVLAASAMTHGEGFWSDLARFREKAGAGDLVTTLRHWKELFALGWFVLLGFAGWLTIRDRRVRWLGLAALLAMAEMVLRKEDTIILFVNYPIIPFWPFVLFGLAALLDFAFRGFLKPVPIFLVDWLGFQIARESVFKLFRLVLILVLVGFVSWGLIHWLKTDLRAISEQFPSRLEFAELSAPDDAKAAAEFVNERIAPDELVIATEAMWPFLKGRFASPPQALAYVGKKCDFYDYDIPKERFTYDCDPAHARFVIIDNISDNVMKTPDGSPHEAWRNYLRDLTANSSPVFKQRVYRVYEFPQKSVAEDQATSR